ncbi:contractile injection system tape measure protein, partial [Nitrosomonas sp.]|uniref:contractile injection system tape measure protein n=1 Tax=Nitrosomonas sp. TaxID=42353 RepID=UPI0025FC1877
MSTIHRIDELIFDCSFDSVAIANEYESEMNAWLTARLLPAIDVILNDFDEAESVLRLDHIEIDLGNISNDDFYVELLRRLQEKLSDKLRGIRKDDQQPELESHGILPAKRFSKIQSDLEKLQDFLLTGSMPWHIDTADARVHEKMLQQVLQEAGGALVTLLKRAPKSDRATLINRLVSQFSQRHLENLLSKIVPTHAHLFLDFLMVYRFAVIESGFVPDNQTEWVDAVWIKLFEFLLDDSRLSANPVVLLGGFVKNMAVMQMQDPVLLLQRISLTAKQFSEEGKIRDMLYVSLQILHAYPIGQTQVSEEDLAIAIATPTPRGSGRDLSGGEVDGLEGAGGVEKAELTTVQPTAEVTRQAEAANESLYSRIVAALRKAKLIELESTTSDSAESRNATLKKQLRDLLRSVELRAQLASKLPESILLDIACLLAPQMAALIEQLLAQAALLYRWPAVTHRSTQKHWKQQIWAASLAYLQTAVRPGTEPAAYIQAIAQSLPDAADSQVILRAWYDALDQSRTFGALHTILQTFRENAPVWNETTRRTADVVTEQSEENAAYWRSHQRLAMGKRLTEQQDLGTMLEELATQYPAQLQRIYQDLRSGRYELTTAQLNAAELRHLVEMLLTTEASISSTDRLPFLQAIETQANQVSDQQPYYQRLLEDLLQGREIDLEAITKMAQRATSRNDNNNPDWNKAAQAEPTDTQSTTQSERKSEIQTTHTALYLRIVAALCKAKLVETESAVSDTTEVRIIALKQQLRDLIRSPELRTQLVSKLPQPILLDIVYLLAPQIAALIEQLLAQGDKLYHSTGITGRSTQTHWRQKIWTASLAYLLEEADSSTEPAAYIEAIAQSLSGEADSQVILRSWYDALDQSKTFGTIHTILQALITSELQWNQPNAAWEKEARAKGIEGIEKAEKAESTSIQPTTEAPRQAEAANESLYSRIVAALRKAKLIELESVALNSPESRNAALKQQLRDLLRSVELRAQLASKLPESILLDITFLLAPQMAALIEQLLAQAALLYRWPAVTHRSTQKHWKQQIWAASLAYLQTAVRPGTEPAAYIQAIAQSLPDAADSQVILRAWYDALDQSRTFGALHTILQTFRENAPVWNETTRRTADVVTEQSEENAAYWRSHQRLAMGKRLTEQQDLGTMLEELATQYPAQLQRIYQDLRSGRYELTTAQLNAAELRHLVEMLLTTEASISSTDRLPFLQAIETQANQVSDQQPYYQRLLEDLLQGREIDLEAITKMAQRATSRNDNNNPDWNKAAQAEPTDTQSTTQSERKSEIQTTHTALYLRIVAALCKAKLVETESAVSDTTEVRIIALKQQLRDLIRSPELRTQLVSKLPQPILLDIVYLLAPQIAALIEQLLAQGDKLYHSTGITGRSTQTHWRQKIWTASLAYLLEEADSSTEPAAYIEAIAQSLSGEADSQVILRSW